jgi:hypothetical protein
MLHAGEVLGFTLWQNAAIPAFSFLPLASSDVRLPPSDEPALLRRSASGRKNVVEKRTGGRSAPITVNSLVRTREYLTGREVERLMAAARKGSRWGHRDATMILIGYRHGLRASELCDLQWSQVELSTGRLHVRRAKNGSPSVHIRCQVRDTRSAAPTARAGAIVARLHDRTRANASLPDDRPLMSPRPVGDISLPLGADASAQSDDSGRHPPKLTELTITQTNVQVESIDPDLFKVPQGVALRKVPPLPQKPR